MFVTFLPAGFAPPRGKKTPPGAGGAATATMVCLFMMTPCCVSIRCVSIAPECGARQEVLSLSGVHTLGRADRSLKYRVPMGTMRRGYRSSTRIYSHHQKPAQNRHYG